MKNQLNKAEEGITSVQKKLENEKLKKEIKGIRKQENALNIKTHIYNGLNDKYDEHDLKFTSEMDQYCNELSSVIYEVIEILNN